MGMCVFSVWRIAERAGPERAVGAGRHGARDGRLERRGNGMHVHAHVRARKYEVWGKPAGITVLPNFYLTHRLVNCYGAAR